MTFDQFNFVLSMMATIAFAVTGVLAVAERRVDFFSAVVLGIITAIGGGTIRDLILNVPVFWATNLSYVQFAILASVITFIAQSIFSKPQILKLFLYVDALGIALFGVAGAFKALELGFGWPLGPLMLGVITAIGGGLMRDVLAGRKTLLMGDEVYTLPVFAGCFLMLVIVKLFPNFVSEGILIGTVTTLVLRSAAIHWSWKVPDWFLTKSN